MSASKKSYIHQVDSSKPLTSETLPELWQLCLEENEDVSKIIFHRPYEEFTRRQMYDQAMLVAKGLLSAGLKRGDVLACFGVRNSDAPIIFIACSSIGVIFLEPCCYSPLQNIMSTVLHKVKPSAVVFGEAKALGAEETCFEVAKTMKEFENFDIKLILYDRKSAAASSYKPHQSWISLDKLIADGGNVSDDDLQKAKSKVDLNEPCFITMTSGSTGHPKFVLTGAALLTNILPCNTQYVPKVTLSAFDMASAESFWYYVICFRLRCNLVALPHEHGDDLAVAREKLEAVQKYKINSLVAASMHQTIIFDDELYREYDVRSLHTMMIQGCFTTDEFKKKVHAVAPDARNLWGMSECWTPVETIPGILLTNPNTVGKVHVNMEMKVVDEEGVIVPRNTAGEIWVRGYCLFIEYVNDPELTAATKTKDGWLKTGDRGYIDDEGLVYLKGRMTSKERFKVMDDTVYPSNIEGVLICHPKIRDCLAVGLTARGTIGHEIVYAVVPRPDMSDLCVEEVYQFTKENMTYSIEWPSRVLFFNSFPRTKSSRRKVDRRAVQQLVEELVVKDSKAGLVSVSD